MRPRGKKIQQVRPVLPSPLLLQRRRGKVDWAGLGIGDAFKANLDYRLRLPAQRLFYRLCGKAQRAAAESALGGLPSGFEPTVAPQISPCYTDYPPGPAALAAIGLSAYLELDAHVDREAMEHEIGDTAVTQRRRWSAHRDPNLVHLCARPVLWRLLLEDLRRVEATAAIEAYRLFLAAQQTLRFETLAEIVETVVLFGDVAPPYSSLDIHPMSLNLIRRLEAASARYFDLLAQPKTPPHREIAAEWALALAKEVGVTYGQMQKAARARVVPGDDNDDEGYPGADAQSRAAGGPVTAALPIAPLDAPMPPSSIDRPDRNEIALRQLLGAALEPAAANDAAQLAGSSRVASEVVTTLAALARALDGATARAAEWEDLRPDALERILGGSPFEGGPIEGQPTSGHEVQVKLGDNQVGEGELFDRPLPLSDDLRAHQDLVRRAQPITASLRRTLYPNVQRLPQSERFRASGALDPGRLALADASETVWKRYHFAERADRRGRPLVVIACDASGSLSPEQMTMTKLLAAGWLAATAGTDVEILAAIYHSGTVREDKELPLVQWMYHRQRTAATGKRDAVRALVSLPDSGTGAQSDALSLGFILDEAHRLARGRAVYLILITDCAWNSSFGGEGRDEVTAVLRTAKERAAGKLNTTLVSLAAHPERGLDSCVDKVVEVSQADLGDARLVAEKIGVYVAACVRERRKVVS